jgi:HAD superfamily phosphoserine phosphatase-like hydrolase
MIAAVIFDLDGTLTTTPNPWRHIHESLGVWDKACGHFDEWLAGSIDYSEFCRKDTSLWRGSLLDQIHGFLDGIPLNRHVPEVTRALTERRVPSIIISSGFHYVARRIAKVHGWEPLMVYANELIEGPDVRIRVSPDLASPFSKRALGASALEKIRIDPRETLVVSDSLHDLEALRDCGFHLHVQHEDDLARTLHFLE